MEEKREKGNFFPPKAAIILFLTLILVLSFYESKKVINWESNQRTEQKYNIFRSSALSFASFSDNLKSRLGLNNFFEKENNFWLKIKESPFLFQEISTSSQNEEKNNENQKNSNYQEIKPEPPFTILIIGDSFIAVWGGMGETLEGELIKYNNVTVKRNGEVSSGLSRPDYFDWPSEARKLVLEQKPNIAIIMLGSNDAQAVTKNSDSKNIVLNYGTEEWDSEYAQRVSDFLKIFEENRIFVFWIGLPIMKNENYSEKVWHLNSIYEKEIQDYKNAYFISTWDLFVDEKGNYTDYLTDEKGRYQLARLQDGVHFSYVGGKIATEEVIKKIREKIELEPKE